MERVKYVDVKTASKSYSVVIGGGIGADYGKLLLEVKKPCKTAIISDDIVFAIYGEKVTKSLENEGFEVCSFVFENGESSKNLNTLGRILNFLAEERITKSDVLIALGGGVVGDITGFASAVFLRGMDFVQLPTTLLAAVDSSVGGKTGIDLEAGKNLAGAFHQPIAVFCDTDCFKTLPEQIFSDGMAEVIKYGVIDDKELFNELMTNKWEISDIVHQCVSIKAKIVGQDERDTGLRQTLNFGHTLGHAVEALSNFQLSHGQAVAIGMIMISELAEKYGLVDEPVSADIKALLEKYNLPVECSFDVKSIVGKVLSDKKRSGGVINLVLPKKTGMVYLYPLEVDKLEAFVGGMFSESCN